MHDPVGHDEIRIAPIIMGSKNGGVVNIILGAVLIAVGYLVQAYLYGAPNPISNALYAAGTSMILGGVVQLLTPVPHGTKNKSVDNEPSYSFNGAVNTQA
ncbi:tail assembly protein [Rhodanobacter lindaniclasticus]|uniref:Uncharacterized protein n=1 Tax=Rhodanobacter lindaniclasticus TaxID=75310 RepID=A0A4S3K6D7_9GAMM|nr:tail assembly protein [Rhodanobacter lindaniclasticus]THD03720.1 hypothetical protein B1991_18245 [Rhodanobacter lindaniclasticus]